MEGHLAAAAAAAAAAALAALLPAALVVFWPFRETAAAAAAVAFVEALSPLAGLDPPGYSIAWVLNCLQEEEEEGNTSRRPRQK